MSDVNMPKLSDTMEEGTVLEWKKQDGDEVRKGEVLAEIESDKASFEIEAEASGVLHITVEQGNPAPVGSLIARIGAAGEAPAAPAGGAPPAQENRQEAQPRAEAPPAEAPQPAPAGEGAIEAPPAAERQEARPRPEPARATSASAAAAAAPPDGVKASPLARRLARERGVDLASIRGTGPEGRIVKEDVLAAAATEPAPAETARPAPEPAPAARPSAPAARPAGADVETVQPSRMQATIARRMTESKTTVPHFYVTVEVRADDVVRMRQQVKQTVRGAERVTATDFITRACAIALTRHAHVNSSWVEDHFERKRSVNIGIAVPPAEGMGLLVPVVHDCDRKDLIQISIETRQVIERARSGRPGEGDLAGGTFSISNLGMYGVDEFSAIINPPEAAILAVGQIKDVPVVEDGQIRAGKVMRMTLSVDHRVSYGAPAAQFMAEVKTLLENPAILLLPPDSV